MSILMACQKPSAENDSDRNVDITASRMTFVMAIEQNAEIMASYRYVEVFKYACLMLILGMGYSLVVVVDQLALYKKR